MHGGIDRVPPQAIAAEQAVLGGLMISPTAWPRVAALIGEGDFHGANHAAIFRAIADLADKRQPFDAVTLGEWLDARQLGDQAGGSEYLIELASTTPSAANIVAHAEIVRDKAALRRLIDVGAQITEAGFDPAGASTADLVADAAAKLSVIVPAHGQRMRTPKESLQAWFAALNERMLTPGNLIGIPTPWQKINEATRGLRPGRLYVMAGRPGMGKSVIGCQLASFSALRGNRTAFFSLEMNDEEVRDRNVAALAEVPQDWLDKPNDDGRQHAGDDNSYWPQVTQAVSQLRNAPLLIDDTPRLSARQLCYRANSLHCDSPLSLIVIDHLHEMHVDAKDRVNALGDAARELKGLAKALQVPILLLAQLNRANTQREDKRPTMSDLRASGAIEEVADVVMLIHREDYYNPETHLSGVVEIALAKGRGIKAGSVINLRNRFDIMRADDWVGAFPTAPDPEPKQKTARGFSGNRYRSGGHE